MWSLSKVDRLDATKRLRTSRVDRLVGQGWMAIDLFCDRDKSKIALEMRMRRRYYSQNLRISESQIIWSGCQDVVTKMRDFENITYPERLSEFFLVARPGPGSRLEVI
jgi:hypothetical protein